MQNSTKHKQKQPCIMKHNEFLVKQTFQSKMSNDKEWYSNPGKLVVWDLINSEPCEAGILVSSPNNNKHSKCSDDSHPSIKLQTIMLLISLKSQQSHKAYCVHSS